jgi:hypothetical protein
LIKDLGIIFSMTVILLLDPALLTVGSDRYKEPTMTTSNQQAAWAFRQHQIGRTQVLDLPRRRQAGRRRPCGLAPEPSVFVLKQPVT